MSKPDPAIDAVNAEQAAKAQAAQDYPMATAADLLGGKAVVREQTVPLPAWGLSIRLRAVTMYEVEEMSQAAMEPDPEKSGGRRVNNARMNRLVTQRSLVAPKLTQDQVDELWGQDYGYIKEIVTEVMRINRMGQFASEGGDAEAVKSVAPAQMDAA